MFFFYLQGKQKQTKRTQTFFQFCNAKEAILLCTDVAARGLDIPAVDWIVQVDPPDDPKVRSSAFIEEYFGKIIKNIEYMIPVTKILKISSSPACQVVWLKQETYLTNLPSSYIQNY